MQTYRVTEFATLTGVTVKTLHHYDRLGLLKPKRTVSRYRLYADSDRDRLEQIAALKFIGLPLTQIKALLDTKSPDAAGALRAQRRALEDQKVRLERALNALDWELHEAERMTQSAGVVRAPDRFNDARISLYHDIAAAVDAGVSVTSDDGRALTARWRAIVDDEMQGVDGVAKTRITEVWAGRKMWPPSLKRYVAGLYRLERFAWERVAEFIDEARTAVPSLPVPSRD